MSDTRLKINLTEAEYRALVEVAAGELRSPADQVRFLVRRELDRRGIYVPEPAPAPAAPLFAAPKLASKGER